MKYILSQDESKYSAWQLTLAVQSIIDTGVKSEDIYVLLGTYGYNKSFKAIERRFKGVNFIRYRQLSPMNYMPAVKPYLLYKFFEEYSYLVSEQWFLMDCDVILKDKIKEQPKGTIYTSDCKSYIGYEYLSQKGLIYADIMARRVGITVEDIKERDSGAGGAQFIFDNVSSDTWKKAWEDSVWIFNKLCQTVNQHVLEDNQTHIQFWTAEMWAVLYNFWYSGHETKIIKELDFVFSTDRVDSSSNVKIIHNAGVTAKDKRLFNKGDFFNKSPKGVDLDIKKGTYNYQYYKYLKENL